MASSNISFGDFSIKEDELQSESLKVIQWHGFFSILLICFCIALAVISTAGKSMIIYFILYKAPKRPMNTMILHDQLGLLLTSLVTKFMTITSLIMATPILHLYGPVACDIYFLIAVAHNALGISGGFAMALFRMLCVQFQSFVSSMEKLMIKLMWMQYALAICILVTSWMALDIYGSSNIIEFARGYSTKMAHILMRQSEERKDFGKQSLHASILLVQTFIILEFACYIVLFCSLRKKNKSLFNIVQEDVLKKRAKKNAITFTGQAISFTIEVTYSILLQLCIHYGNVGGFFEPGAVPCALLIMMAAVTSSQILASPELRRFIQGID